jgi:hypothetical protein
MTPRTAGRVELKLAVWAFVLLALSSTAAPAAGVPVKGSSKAIAAASWSFAR